MKPVAALLMTIGIVALGGEAKANDYSKHGIKITQITVPAEGYIYFYFDQALGCGSTEDSVAKFKEGKEGMVVTMNDLGTMTITKDVISRWLTIATAAYLSGKKVRASGPMVTSGWGCPLGQLTLLP